MTQPTDQVRLDEPFDKFTITCKLCGSTAVVVSSSTEAGCDETGVYAVITKLQCTRCPNKDESYQSV